jgi:signal transduction histidine kinase
MAISQDLSFHRTLPSTTFEQLGQLLKQMVQEVGTEAVVLTEAVLSPVTLTSEQLEQFILVVSQQFSALLVGARVQESKGAKEHEEGGIEQNLAYYLPPTTYHSPSTTLDVRFTFESEAIALFLRQLSSLLQHNSQAQATLAKYCQIPRPNDATLQSKFTLLLLSVLVPEQNPNSDSAALYPYVSVCQPVEDALRQQVAHERLLNQVTTQIRQSLDLPVIIATVVEQVREFLQVDRLVIYQFETGDRRSQRSEKTLLASTGAQPCAPTYSLLPHGYIVYEARATNSIPSVLHYKEETCFIPNSQCWEKYRQGFTLAVADIENAYIISPCLLNFLRTIQVRAKLVAPIVFQEKLWGLLIAHQCTEPRLWLDSEKNLLGQIAEQLAIAIHQAELMRSLKQEKQTLEQRVVERTQALHDALIAAQAASRAKSEFLATISHELRTPLTRVIGMSDTLLRWPLGELSQRQRQYLQIIHDSGEHLLELINDILELSELEAGKAVLNISEFSLAAIAEGCLRSLSEKAKHQAVTLTLDLKTEPTFRLHADPQRVGQILWNLLSNAIKFTPEGGQVILRVWSENGTAVLQVEDTGIGISQEHLPLLFEKFQQLDTPYRRRYSGTGLGLALTKQLVELHRGRIEVESTLGMGSIFTAWLPLNYE